jgi:hypothetical protein
MNKLMIALIAGTFAAAVGAQTTMQKLETPADKAKQAEVQAVTKGGGNNDATGQAAAAGSAKAKTEKNQPKALPTKADKQKAVDAATKSQTEGAATSGQAAAKGSAAAKAEKNQPKALQTTKEKQQAVDAATAAGSKNAGGGGGGK